MRYLRYMQVSSGVTIDYSRDSFGGRALASVRPHLLVAMASDDPVPIPGLDGFGIIATDGGRCLSASICSADGTAIVNFGVALHSRCGAALWRDLHDSVALPCESDQPPAPWCAVFPASAAITRTQMSVMHSYILHVAWSWIDMRCAKDQTQGGDDA
jgi:hypothetical protein